MDSGIVAISSYKVRGLERCRLRSVHPFFENKELIIEFHSDKIIFKVPSISHNGKTFKVYRNKYSNLKLTFKENKARLGKFKIDEGESNEDQLVVYYE